MPGDVQPGPLALKDPAGQTQPQLKVQVLPPTLHSEPVGSGLSTWSSPWLYTEIFFSAYNKHLGVLLRLNLSLRLHSASTNPSALPNIACDSDQIWLRPWCVLVPLHPEPFKPTVVFDSFI